MNFFHISILSIVEGITEFLPISSTAHLLLTAKILGLKQTPFLKVFEVAIQSGAILSVILLYLKTFLKNKELTLKITISFLPTAFFGLVFYKLIKNLLFESYGITSFNLIFVGLIFIIVEEFIKRGKIKLSKDLKNLDLKTAFLIGFFQSFAIFPGVSRAGAVILSMLILGFKRKPAVEYSFLLAVPTIISASAFDIYKNADIVFSQTQNLSSLTLGLFLSFISALLTIKWLLKFVKNHDLKIFGYYRLFIGTLSSLI